MAKSNTPNSAYILLTYSLPLVLTLMGLMGLLLYHFNHMQGRVLETYQKIKSVQSSPACLANLPRCQNEQVAQYEAQMTELLQDRNGITALMIALSFGVLATITHRTLLHVKQVELQLSLANIQVLGKDS